MANLNKKTIQKEASSGESKPKAEKGGQPKNMKLSLMNEKTLMLENISSTHEEMLTPTIKNMNLIKHAGKQLFLGKDDQKHFFLKQKTRNFPEQKSPHLNPLYSRY